MVTLTEVAIAVLRQVLFSRGIMQLEAHEVEALVDEFNPALQLTDDQQIEIIEVLEDYYGIEEDEE